MIQLDRNIYIEVRRKNYVFLKGLAAKKKMTTTDLIKAIVLKEQGFNQQFLDEITKLKTYVYELKELSKIWNSHTKQINANIENRTEIDRQITADFMDIISGVYTQYFVVRNYSSIKMNDGFIYTESDNLIYQNRIKLSASKWARPKLRFNESEFISIQNAFEKSDCKSINQFILEQIYIFQNQSTFEKNLVTEHCRKIICLLKNMKNNAAQIWKNRKNNARANEIVLAKNISDYLCDKIEDFVTDPLLYSGRRFNPMYYYKMVN